MIESKKATFAKANSSIGGWTTEEAPKLDGALIQSLRVMPPEDRILLIHMSTFVEDYDAKWGEWDHSRSFHESVITLVLVGERNKKVTIQVNGGSPIHNGYLSPERVLWHEIAWGDGLTADDTVTITIDGASTVLRMARPMAQDDGTRVWTAAQLA